MHVQAFDPVTLTLTDGFNQSISNL